MNSSTGGKNYILVLISFYLALVHGRPQNTLSDPNAAQPVGNIQPGASPEGNTQPGTLLPATPTDPNQAPPTDPNQSAQPPLTSPTQPQQPAGQAPTQPPAQAMQPTVPHAGTSAPTHTPPPANHATTEAHSQPYQQTPHPGNSPPFTFQIPLPGSANPGPHQNQQHATLRFVPLGAYILSKLFANQQQQPQQFG